MPSPPLITFRSSLTAALFTLLAATSRALINQLSKAAASTITLSYKASTDSGYTSTIFDSSLSTSTWLGTPWQAIYDEGIYSDFSNGGCISYIFPASSTLPVEL
jgi:hypothetical protein